MTYITEQMKDNEKILHDLIIARQNKEKYGSKPNEIKYNAALKSALDKFHYIVEMNANRYKRYSNYQDLIQEGMIGLIFALNNFNPERSKNFFKIANWYIKTRIRRAANKYDVINIPLKVGKEGGALQRINDIPVIVDPMCSMEETIETDQVVENIRVAIECLDDIHKKVICLYYGIDHQNGNYNNGLSLTNIAKQLKTSRANVEVLLIEAFEELKQNDNILNIS